MAQPDDWDEYDLLGFLDIKTGRATDPFPQEWILQEHRWTQDSLEPTSKCGEEALILEDPIEYGPNHTKVLPDEELPLPDIVAEQDSLENTCNTYIPPFGKCVQRRFRFTIESQSKTSESLTKRSRFKILINQRIFETKCIENNGKSNGKRLSSRSPFIHREITRSCFSQRGEMDNKNTFGKVKHNYKRMGYRERLPLLVFYLYLISLILAVADCSFIDIHGGEERIVLVCRLNGTNNISCEVGDSRLLGLRKFNGTSHDTDDTQDSFHAEKRGVVCAMGQVYHSIRDWHSGRMVEGCAKPIQCTKGSFPQLFKDEKKQTFVQCVVCDENHYQPNIIESSKVKDELVLKPRISLEMRKELDKMVRIESHWPYGADKYACDTKKGYSNILRQHLCNVTSPCICTRYTNCRLEHGLELLPDGSCDKICIGERDPLNQFKCKGQFIEIEGSLAYIAFWVISVVSVLMVYMSAIVGATGIRLKYLKQSTTAYHSLETVIEVLKMSIHDVRNKHEWDTNDDNHRTRNKIKHESENKHKDNKRKMVENVVRDKDPNKHSMCKIKEDRTYDVENGTPINGYINKDKWNEVQGNEDFCTDKERCKGEYMSDNNEFNQDEFHDSGMILSNKDFQCMENDTDKIEIIQKNDDNKLTNDKEENEKENECERTSITDNEKKVEHSDDDGLYSGTELYDEDIYYEAHEDLAQEKDKEKKSTEDEGYHSGPIQESITDLTRESGYGKEVLPTGGRYQSVNHRSHSMSFSSQIIETRHVQDDYRICSACFQTFGQQNRCTDVETNETVSDSERYSNDGMNDEIDKNIETEITPKEENDYDTMVTLTDRIYKGTESVKDEVNKNYQSRFPPSETRIDRGLCNSYDQRDDNSSLRSDCLYGHEDICIKHEEEDASFHKLSDSNTDNNIQTQMFSLKTFDKVSEELEKKKILVEKSNEANEPDNETCPHLDWPDSSTEVVDHGDYSLNCKQDVCQDEQTDSDSNVKSEFLEKEMEQQKKESTVKACVVLSPMISYSSGYPLDSSEDHQSNDLTASDIDCKSEEYFCMIGCDRCEVNVPTENIDFLETQEFNPEMLRCIEQYCPKDLKVTEENREEELGARIYCKKKNIDTSQIITDKETEKQNALQIDSQLFHSGDVMTYHHSCLYSHKLFLNDWKFCQIEASRNLEYLQWMMVIQSDAILHNSLNMINLRSTWNMCGHLWFSQSKAIENLKKSVRINKVVSVTLQLKVGSNTKIEKTGELTSYMADLCEDKTKEEIERESIDSRVFRMHNNNQNQVLINLNSSQTNYRETDILLEENDSKDNLSDFVENNEGKVEFGKTMISSSDVYSDEVNVRNSQSQSCPGREETSVWVPVDESIFVMQNNIGVKTRIKREKSDNVLEQRHHILSQNTTSADPENKSFSSIEAIRLKIEEKFCQKRRKYETKKLTLPLPFKQKRKSIKQRNQCSITKNFGSMDRLQKQCLPRIFKRTRKVSKKGFERPYILEVKSGEMLPHEDVLCSLESLNQSLSSVGLVRSVILDSIENGRKLHDLAQEKIRKENKQREGDLLQSWISLFESFHSPRFIRNLRSLTYFRPEPTILEVFPGNGLHRYFQQLETGPVSREESMKFELVRLASLSSYSGNGSAVNLARHGFYKDPELCQSATRCYACGLLYTDWEYFDNIQEVHRRLSPYCPHLSEITPTSENVSTNHEPQPNEPAVVRNSPETTMPSSDQTTTNSTPSVASVTNTLQITHLEERNMVPEGFPSQPTEDRENSQFSRATPGISGGLAAIGALPRNVQTTTHGNARLTSQTEINNTATGTRSNEGTGEKTTVTSQPSNPQARPPLYTPALGGAGKLREINQGNAGFSTTGDEVVYGVGDPRLVNVENPKHRDYRTIDSRTASFTSLWPSYLDQTPRQMAEAGFFYAGVADFTRCFACGGGLRNWEAGDDPCLEHTRWYPRCEYMSKLKGTRYVEAVTRRQEQHLAEQRRRQQQLQQQRQQAQRPNNNTPPDPMSTPAAAVLLEMGYTRERIMEAILAVRRNTGHNFVNAEQALLWILDEDERASQNQSTTTSTSSEAVTTTSASTSFSSSAPGRSSAPGGTSSTASSNSTTTTTTLTSSPAVTTTSASTSVSSSVSGWSSSMSSSNSTTTTTSASSASASGTSSQGQGQNGSAKGSTKKNEEKKKGDEKEGEKNEGKDSLKKGAEGEQPTSGKKKKNGKKKGKGGGANGLLGGATGVVGGATGGKGENSKKEAEEEKHESQSLDTQSLKAENQKLREMQTCKICMDKPVNMTLLPCGHLVCCENCVPHLRKCPICRKRIEGSVKTFLS